MAIDKLIAARHLLHASIRMIFVEEDAYATHLCVQSADRLILDLAKHIGADLPFDFEKNIKPEHKAAVISKHRELYNFLKHADRDPTEVMDDDRLVTANDIATLRNIQNYSALTGTRTTHSAWFSAYASTAYPFLLVEGETRAEFEAHAKSYESREQLLFDIQKVSNVDPNFASEKIADLQLVMQARALKPGLSNGE